MFLYIHLSVLSLSVIATLFPFEMFSFSIKKLQASILNADNPNLFSLINVALLWVRGCCTLFRQQPNRVFMLIMYVSLSLCCLFMMWVSAHKWYWYIIFGISVKCLVGSLVCYNFPCGVGCVSMLRHFLLITSICLNPSFFFCSLFSPLFILSLFYRVWWKISYQQLLPLMQLYQLHVLWKPWRLLQDAAKHYLII